LTPESWLDAAFHAVVEGGFEKARVQLLAHTLGVTRGSFYWHFTDHAELISSLLMRWRDRELDLIYQNKLNHDSLVDPLEDLVRLLDVALQHAGKDLINMRFELALRGLGRRDARVAEKLAEVDKARMNLFQHKFLRLTNDPQKAGELASLFYLSIVGSHQALSRPVNTPQLSAYLKRIICLYLIDPHFSKTHVAQSAV
jgi:AcrR family transcriptional regulator